MTKKIVLLVMLPSGRTVALLKANGIRAYWRDGDEIWVESSQAKKAALVLDGGR